MYHRMASLTSVEAFFLHGLLVDETSPPNEHLENAYKRLDDNVLFSTMPDTVPASTSAEAAAAAQSPIKLEQQQHNDEDEETPWKQIHPLLPPNHRKAKRISTVGLWKAHQDGVTPERLRSKSVGYTTSNSNVGASEDVNNKKLIVTTTEDVVLPPITTILSSSIEPTVAAAGVVDGADAAAAADINDDERSAASDVEVRPEHHHHRRGSKTDDDDDAKNNNDIDSISGSSWDEGEHTENFDAWEVLRDEYAQDFGFDYSQRHVTMESIINDNDENEGNTFNILGTSVHDKSAQPHVLSPPLMDALLSIIGTPTLVPNLIGQNFWLRYSLIRDGASLSTLKQYVRAAKYTILAIETPSGNVFGSFTSSPWRNALSFYGGPPAFVWKMRHSRRTKCSSLFDQAQLESEIDVYMCANANSLCQVCRHDSLAIGGDDGAFREGGGVQDDDDDNDDHFKIPAAMEDLAQGGFAFALEEDLMCGTTSPCVTFTSPALYGKGDRSNVFDVAGLEIWSFTPCHDVKSAEKLEMTQFFIEESSRNGSMYSTTSTSSSQFTSRDLIQEDFYRRVGQDLESDERRQRWQYANMMNPMGGAARGFGASPRYGYSNNGAA